MNRQAIVDTLRTHLTDGPGAYNVLHHTLSGEKLGEIADAIARQFDGNWRPDRLWRVVYADGSTYPPDHYLADQRRIWCETSDEREARAALTTCPGGGVLQRLHTSTMQVWSDVQ